MKIDILGSCVTRDVFNFTDKFKIQSYFARTSLASIYSKPINISLDDFELPSAFQKKMVFNDLTKYFRKYIKSTKADFLIIDFIDERFGILKHNDSFITASAEYNKSNLNQILKPTRLTPSQKLLVWEKSALEFIEEVKNYYTPQKIILHKCFYKEKFKSKYGEIVKFEQSYDYQNELLSRYYNFFEEKFTGINVIELDKQFLASETHRWGLTPYHYEDEYYIQFINELKKLS
jgi:hypothetical protein